MGEPNELPEGGEGGGGGGIFGGIRGEWPAELPIGPDYGPLQAILTELGRIQLRVQTLESARLQAQVLGAGRGVQTRAAFYRPNELPEGGEGGGGGIFGGGIRGEWPQELPPIDIFTQLVERLALVETVLNERLGAIEAKLNSIGG